MAALITKQFTFSTGATILASEHNTNYNVIYNDYNGNITNANINASAAIADTKLAQISTASKVAGDALTSLANIPAGAGEVPLANLPSIDEDNMASDSDTSLPTQQSVKAYADSLVKSLGSWASATVGSSTQVTDDSFLVGFATTADTASGQDLTIKTDSAATPTTTRQKVTLDSNDFGTNYSVFCPVKASDYYLIEKHASITATIYIIPLA